LEKEKGESIKILRINRIKAKKVLEVWVRVRVRVRVRVDFFIWVRVRVRVRVRIT
jgi:hypothetical protein